MFNDSNLKNILIQAKELVSILEKAKNLIAQMSGGVEEIKDVPEKKTITPESLSPKEREVWDLFAQNLSVAQIAEKMGISGKTVTIHRDHIRQKLNLKTYRDLYKLLGIRGY